MAFRVKHSFTSAKSDGVDTTLVRPSNWNDDHLIEMNAGKIMGRDASGAGNAQELSLSFSAAGDPDFDDATGALGMPTGTTGQRIASPRNGHFRYNTTLAAFEGYVASAWKQLLSSTITVVTTMVGAAFNEAVRADVASATTCNIGAAASNSLRVTGTTDISSFGTCTSGMRRHLYFAGSSLTIEHNTTILLPNNGEDIETASGDTALFIAEASNVWRCHSYTRADGTSVGAPVRDYDEYTSSSTLTNHIPADNSIPQVGEGTEILSVTVAPLTSTSRVRIMATVPIGAPSGVSGIACAALFRNGGANAIDAKFVRLVDGFGNYDATILFEHVPASTSDQEYTIRVGGDTFNVLVNADISGRLGGGVSRASLVAEVI